MGPPFMSLAYESLDIVTNNECGCVTKTSLHTTGLCSIVNYISSFPFRNFYTIGIDFSMLRWRVLTKLIRNREWPQEQDILNYYNKTISLLEKKLSEILGDKFMVYGFIDDFSNSKFKYLTRYNRYYEYCIKLISDFPLLCPGSYLWNTFENCYHKIQSTSHFELVSSDGESDGYMIKYLNDHRNVIICSCDNDIPLLGVLNKGSTIISNTNNGYYKIFDTIKLGKIIRDINISTKDFIFIFYLFVTNDFHYGIKGNNTPLLFFENIFPLCRNQQNLRDKNNLVEFLLYVQDKLYYDTEDFEIEEHNAYIHLNVSYGILEEYKVGTDHPLDRNVYCKNPKPIDIKSLIFVLKTNQKFEDSIMECRRNCFVETLAFLPQMDYEHFEKTIQRMFPTNSNDIGLFYNLWDIFRDIKECRNKKKNLMCDKYGNPIEKINKKPYLPSDFDTILNDFYRKERDIMSIYEYLISSEGKLPNCDSLRDVCKDYLRNGFCKYKKCKFRHIDQINHDKANKLISVCYIY